MLLLRQYALLFRLPNSFTVVSNIVAANVVASAGHPSPRILLASLLASLLFYHGGMVLNDCLDFDTDSRERPGRPLPSGAIPLRLAWALALAMLAGGLLLTLYLGGRALVVGLALLLAIVLYNTASRQNLLGCLWMGACRALNWCLPLAALGAIGHYWVYPLVVGVYVAALTLISRDEVAAQRPGLVYLSGLGMLLSAALLLAWLYASQTLSLVSGLVIGAGAALILVRLWRLLGRYNAQDIQQMVMFLVLGLIPLDAALTLVAGQPLWAIFVVLLFPPGRLLARKLYVT